MPRSSLMVIFSVALQQMLGERQQKPNAQYWLGVKIHRLEELHIFQLLEDVGQSLEIILGMTVLRDTDLAFLKVMLF